MITCPNCSTQNLDGVRFCVQCGTALAPPPESWRDTDDTNTPRNSPYGTQQPGTGGYTPPYATPPPMPPPPSFSTPLPAMSYGTHGASSSGTMQLAEWLPRVGGALIDGVATVALYVVLLIPLGILGSVFGSDGGVFQALTTMLAFFAYMGFIIFNDIYLRSTRGSTIGQGVLGLKTVTADNTPLPMGTAAVRFIVKFAIGLVPCIGALLDNLWPLWDEKKQTLHDKAVGTFVVKK